MENPMLFWYIVVGALLIAFFVRFVRATHHISRHRDRLSHHFIEIGREKDMFYIPGDAGYDDE